MKGATRRRQRGKEAAATDRNLQKQLEAARSIGDLATVQTLLNQMQKVRSGQVT